jgi:signal peptidase II
MVWLIIIALLSSADQLIKAIIRSNIAATNSVTVIDGFFYIINRKNTGAAWSFLAGQPWGIYALASFSAVVSIVMLVILFKTTHRKLKICLAIICAGSIGNLIDRVKGGGVIDYLDFHFGTYIFPTFNLADMMIVCGTILLCLLILLDPSLLAAKTVHIDDHQATANDSASQGGPRHADQHPD